VRNAPGLLLFIDRICGRDVPWESPLVPEGLATLAKQCYDLTHAKHRISDSSACEFENP
jgi:hypothetical protein